MDASKLAAHVDASIPLAQVVSLLIAGQFASTIGWRWSFVLVASIGLLNFAASFLLKPVPAQKNSTTRRSTRSNST